jgi:hypothetical protein
MADTSDNSKNKHSTGALVATGATSLVVGFGLGFLVCDIVREQEAEEAAGQKSTAAK